METIDSGKFGREKRAHTRRILRTRVIFEDETGEGLVYFYSTDISEGGLFFESDVPLQLGTRIFLQFALHEGEKPLRGIGRVVRIERETEDAELIIGMGVQFMDLGESQMKRIRDYVSASK